MNIKLESTSITRRYSVNGAADIPEVDVDGYMVPRTVEVTFTDGAWNQIEISGPRVKKDGTPSANWTYMWFGAEDEEEADSIPDWMRELTRFDYTPGGDQ